MVSFPSSLVVFLGFHPYMCLFFIQKTFCDLFFFFLGGGGGGGGGGGLGGGGRGLCVFCIVV